MLVDEIRPEAEPVADEADGADVGDEYIPYVRQHPADGVHPDAGPLMPARSGSADEPAGVMHLFPPDLVGEEEARPVAEAAPEARDLEETEVLSGVAGIEAEEEEGDEEAEARAAEPAAEPQDSRAWYVVHCYSGYENKVKHNLEQRIETMQMQSQIFQVVVPTEDEIEVREGKRRVIERRVFPGYILVQMLMNDDSWYVVRNTPGVTGFVGMGNTPTPLRYEEVQAIMKRMEAEAPKIKVTFKQGQKVRIVDGPFNEFIGMVDAIDMERAKVRVLVSFFGRETPVELDFLQVEKA